MARHILAGIVALIMAGAWFFAGFPEVNFVFWTLMSAAAAGLWTALGDRWAEARSFTSFVCALLMMAMAHLADPLYVPEHVRAALFCVAIGILSTFLATVFYIAWSPRPRMKR
jgi:hypothetical protein